MTTTFPAHAQAPQPKPEESCGDIERSYDMIRADAVSMQTNIALFAAADRGCEPLARKLIAAGGSVLARDRRGAMPLAHAARGGQRGWLRFSWPKARRSTRAMLTASTALFAAAEGEKRSTVALAAATRAPIPI